MIEKIETKNFTLVLSGGGALGIAHLGVLHDLEAQNLEPAELVGTSMGGIIAACLSIGMSEAQIYKEIQAFSALTKWMKFSFTGNAIIDNRKIATIFETLFAGKKMRETKIPLKLISTHLKDGHKRVFTAEDDVTIKDALLATMAIPGIFSEHVIEGETYADGFLCENLGLSEATYAKVLAIDVLGENSFDKNMPDNFFKTANVLEMFEKSIRLLIYNQSKTQIKHAQNEVYLIEPSTRAYATFSFHKHKEIRALGLNLLQ